MSDLIYVALTVALLAVSYGLVLLCEQLMQEST
jgi:hypothetical protein